MDYSGLNVETLINLEDGDCLLERYSLGVLVGGVDMNSLLTIIMF